MSTIQRLTITARRAYRRVFRREADTEIEYRVKTLRKTRLFGTVPKRHLRDLAEVIHERSYDRGEFVYYEGDPGLGLYVVVEGRVRLAAGAEDGAEALVADIDELEEFGLLSLLGDLPRQESAQAAADSILFGIFRPDLRAVERRNPRSGAALMEVLSATVAAQCAAAQQELRAGGGHSDRPDGRPSELIRFGNTGSS